MDDNESLRSERLPEEYLEHSIFGDLVQTEEFYEFLSDLIWPQISPTRNLLGNLDSSFFDSLAGTVESMRAILLTGRITDAYTLLRKFNESTLLQIYTMLCFEEKIAELRDTSPKIELMDQEKFVQYLEHVFKQGIYVEEIEDWLTGDKSLPNLRIISPKVASFSTTSQLDALFDSQKYKQISERCNDHVHTNYYKHLVLNQRHLKNETLIVSLKQFAQDFRDLLTKHITFVLFLHPEYMRSSDYVDHLECGLVPEHGSEYWIAPFIKDFFNNVITPLRPEVVEFIVSKSGMIIIERDDDMEI
ncbi:MAG: hypothetical protein KF824_05400 [Fimbriimonadaceae bacterium]|nr:MAG: hypothetical protein KF824_05400 [Fimbriimonadaceae bacterium]